MSNKDSGLRIVCLQENLKSSLNIAERVSGNNLSLPILSNVLIDTEKGFLKISSTDLEMGVELLVSCKVEGSGSCVIPVKLVLNFINNLPNTKLEMEEVDGKLKISSDKIKTIIPIIDKDEFPIIPKIKNSSDIIMSSKILKKSLNQVLNSLSISDSKPEISGVFFNFSKEFSNIVSTDSFRLSEKTIKNSDIKGLESNKSFILPQKTAQELVKILDSDNDVVLKIGDGQVLFVIDKINLISRIIDGDYPNYKQIIPKSSLTDIVLDKEELISKLKLAGIFSSNINDVRFCIDTAKKEFILRSKDSVKGEFSSDVEFDELSGDSVEIVFNVKYLLDGVLNTEGDVVRLRLNGPSAPSIISSEKNNDYIYVIMPIKA